ncbi:MAG: efflux RND transporter periplasmic adaptor subunit [Planctomycetia bacterium]
MAKAEQRDVAAAVPFVGTVFPVRVSEVGSAVDGRVISFPLLAGQHVDAGQPIARLLTKLLEIEREGAVAELERRRQILAELRAGSRPEEIARARADVQGLVARRDYAAGRLDRLRRLTERGTSTADELLDGEREFRQAEALLRSGEATLALAEAGPRQEQVAQAAAAVATQEAEVDRIDDQLGKHTIRSPFNGWVTERFTEEGQWLARGGLVARIAQLDTVEIDVQVPELSIGSLATGADVRLEFDAAPNQTWIGRVERAVPQADLLSRSFPVKVSLANRVVDGEPVLRGGMLARAWLPVGKTGPATVVPKDALVLGGRSPMVYAVTVTGDAPQGTVQPVEVSLGSTIDGAVEVRGGIEPGQIVVVRGNERLRPGMAVSFAAP